MGSEAERVKYSGRWWAFCPAERVDIALGPSRGAKSIITAMAAATLAVVLCTPMHPLAKAILVLAVAAHAVAARRRHARLVGPRAVRRLRVDLAGAARVTGADGVENTGRILDGSFVAPWLTIVRWLPDGARFSRTVLVLPDMVDADEFRRLRILLRWS
jgi:toxin CptA